MRYTYLCFALMGVLGSTANAEDFTGLTYAQFEESVTHLDLETCPAALAGPARFCRLTIGADAVHVFVFSEEDEQVLLATRSYEDGAYEISLN